MHEIETNARSKENPDGLLTHSPKKCVALILASQEKLDEILDKDEAILEK